METNERWGDGILGVWELLKEVQGGEYSWLLLWSWDEKVDLTNRREGKEKVIENKDSQSAMQ